MEADAHRVWVLGAINVDETVEVDRLPRSGETTVGSGFIRGIGGKGANQAIASARAGASTSLIGAVGADDGGRWALDVLGAAGVNIAEVGVESGSPTGRAIIALDARAANFILVGIGAGASIGIEQVESGLVGARPGDVLGLQLELDPALAVCAVAEAAARRVTTVLNASPVPEARECRVPIPGVDVLVVNEREARAWAGGDSEGSLEKVVEQIAAGWGCAVVCTTGPEGALLFRDGMTVRVPAPDLAPVDTSGAGDTFAGYLAAGMAEGMTLDRAAERAVIAASIAVTRHGTSAAIPMCDELNELVLVEQRSK